MLVLVLLAPVLAAPAVAVLAGRALHKLQVPSPTGRLQLLWVLAGAIAGEIAALVTIGAKTVWVFPAVFVVAVASVAAACCDARAQRIPTPLVRTAGLLAGLLLMLAAVSTHRPTLLLVPVGCAAFAAAVTGLCWRFFDLGRGDVRLATMSALGLCRPSPTAVALSLLGFVGIVVTQLVLARRRRHRSGLPAFFPLGPALVVLILGSGL